MNDKFDSDVQKVLQHLHDPSIGLDTIDDIVVNSIRIVQRIVTDRNQGAYKKDLVIAVLRHLVDKSDLPRTSKNILYEVIEYTIPYTIDFLIGVAKGEIDLYKIKKKLKCLGC